MNLKEKLPIIIGVIVFVILCGVSYYYIFEKDYTYYTQIDNTKIKELDTSSSMKYEYNLEMYDTNGNQKKIKFKTSRNLREGAFLKVKYYFISGVNKWEEVDSENLPKKVKSKYNVQ